jgi:hypothetical protein
MSVMKESGIEDGVKSGSSAPNDTYDETQYYMSGSKLAILISGLCLALFLLGLDTAIVSTVRTLNLLRPDDEADLLSRLFLGSLKDFTQRRMSGGMEVHTFLPCKLVTLSNVQTALSHIHSCSLLPLGGKLYSEFSLKVERPTYEPRMTLIVN